MHHDDFKFEPVPGLPEALPKGEHILWQGRPDSLRLAKDAWKLNWVLGYFILLAVWRVGVSSTAYPLTEAMAHGIPFLIGGALAGLILYVMAVVQARSTIYTLTNKRVAMRIGAALTVTFNIPFVQAGNAMLELRKGGTGTIALDTIGDTRLSYLTCWPHVRPWHMKNTQPALRCIPDAERVAGLLSEAVETRVSAPVLSRQVPTGAVAAE